MSNTAPPKEQQNPDGTKPNHQPSVIEPSGATSENQKTYKPPDGTDASVGKKSICLF